MTNRLEEFSRTTVDAARSLASRQAEAGMKYLDVVRRFGQGETDVAKYGTELVEVGFREGVKSAETYISVGSKWLQSAIIIVGGRVEEAATEAEHAVRAGARAAKSAAGESKS